MGSGKSTLLAALLGELQPAVTAPPPGAAAAKKAAGAVAEARLETSHSVSSVNHRQSGASGEEEEEGADEAKAGKGAELPSLDSAGGTTLVGSLAFCPQVGTRRLALWGAPASRRSRGCKVNVPGTQEQITYLELGHRVDRVRRRTAGAVDCGRVLPRERGVWQALRRGQVPAGARVLSRLTEGGSMFLRRRPLAEVAHVSAVLRDGGDGAVAQVLRACALLPDVAILPKGDATELGERGINVRACARTSPARVTNTPAKLPAPATTCTARLHGSHWW